MQLVDNFAGGGGASLGIELALGRPVDIAVNHDAEAVAMHRANHPRHHPLPSGCLERRSRQRSRAAAPSHLPGSAPTARTTARPRVPPPYAGRDCEVGTSPGSSSAGPAKRNPPSSCSRTSREFADWGPLVAGRPDKARAGETFRHWIQALRRRGLHRRMARAARLRLRRPHLPQASLRHRAARRPPDRLARTDPWARPQSLPHGRRVHRLDPAGPLDLPQHRRGPKARRAPPTRPQHPLAHRPGPAPLCDRGRPAVHRPRHPCRRPAHLLDRRPRSGPSRPPGAASSRSSPPIWPSTTPA